MRILYIHQYFITPKEPGGTRSYWISRKLIEHGHEVTMLTSSATVNKNATKGNVNIDGIDVIYLNIPYHGSMPIKQRFIAFLKFALITSKRVLTSRDFDLIIATSTPLTVGIPALVGQIFKGIPYIFEVRDLWPEVPIQMGGLKNKQAIKLAQWLEYQIYKRAKHIIALSPGMKDGVLSKGIPEDKVNMIPNMSKPDAFWPREKDNGLIERLGLQKNSFKVTYFGALGLANGLDYILDAAEILKDERDIEFLFSGGGGAEQDFKNQCEERELTNVHFLGNFPMNILSEIVNLADVTLVTFMNLPILATNSPNKLFDSLSAGKPIIVNSNGWTKALVEENKCGLYTDPLDPSDLARKIHYLKDRPQLCVEMGRNSRRLALEEYDQDILCTKFAKVVDNLDMTDMTAVTP